MELVTYLAFDGNCNEAFRSYERVLGGQILMLMRGSDMPAEMGVPAEFGSRVMHVRLKVGDALLMGGDAPVGTECRPQGFSVNIMIADPAEAERIFRELAEGGSVRMPLAESFWARRFGMLTDRFGVPWMVNCEKPMGAPETEGEPFRISREFDVPRDVLYGLFSDAERMKPWWGPKGVKVIEARMDLRPGGLFHYAMQWPSGDVMWGRFRYREIQAPDRMVFVNSFSDPHGGLSRHPLAPNWPVEMLSTFQFEEVGPNRSRFTVSWVPIHPTPEERQAFESGFDSMRQGWGGTMEQLDAHLKTL